MAGIRDLSKILASMKPELSRKKYIFCTLSENLLPDIIIKLNPLCFFKEKEGVSLILEKETAEANHIEFDTVYSLITLSVHSSLEAVGLTAAFSEKLASKDISCNVVAAYYHDHIFVQEEKTVEAMSALLEFQDEHQNK